MGKNIFVSDKLKALFKEAMKTGRVILFHAPCGFGKTSVADELLTGRSVLRLSARDARISLPKTTSGWDVLFIDDFQYLMDRTLLEELYRLIYANRQKRFVLLTRGMVPSWLLEFSSAGQLLLIDKDNLAFTREELIDYLDGFGLALSPLDVTAALQEHGGYPLAVRMIKDQLAGGHSFGRTLIDTVRTQIDRYLEGAVLQRFPYELQKSLVLLSMFQEFDVELVRIVTGLPEAETLMQQLLMYTSSLEEISTDHFRFIPAFQRCLSARFSVYFSDKERREIFQKAAGHYLSREDLCHALACYVNAGDFDSVAAVFESREDFRPGIHRYQELAEYLFLIPEPLIQSSPLLLRHQCLAHARKGNMVESEALYHRLAKMGHTSDKELCKKVQSQLIWLDMVLPQRDVCLLPNKLAEAVALYEDGNLEMYPLPLTGLYPSVINGYRDLSALMPRLDSFLAGLEEAYRQTREASLLGTDICIAAEHQYNTGMEVGSRMLRLASLLREVQRKGLPETEFAIVGILIFNLIDVGQPDEASRMIQNLRNRFVTLGEVRFLPNIDAMKCITDLYLDDLDSAGLWYREKAPMDCININTTKTYLYLAQIMVEITLGRYTTAQITLAALESFFTDADRRIDSIHIYFLKAIAFYRQNDPAWKESFCYAFELAESLGYVRAISRYGKAILPLLEKLSAKYQSPFFDDALKRTRIRAAQYPMFMQIHNSGRQIEPLTEAEYNILKLICVGKSNQEICDILGIKLPTAKTHVSHILDKMGVKRRNELKYVAEKLRLIT